MNTMINFKIIDLTTSISVLISLKDACPSWIVDPSKWLQNCVILQLFKTSSKQLSINQMCQKMKNTTSFYNTYNCLKIKKKKSERTLQYLTNTSENNQTHSFSNRYWIVKQSTWGMAGKLLRENKSFETQMIGTRRSTVDLHSWINFARAWEEEDSVI